MAQQLTIAPQGLWTNPNPLSAAPDGAMTQADDVIFARPGIVQPRPGFQIQSAFTAASGNRAIIRMIPFEGDILVITRDPGASTGNAYWYTANDDMVQAGPFIGSSSGWTVTVGQVHGAIMGGNLYVTCGEGVFRCSAPGDDNAYRAGLARPAQAQVASATTGGVNYPLAADQAVAYRLCHTATAGRLVLRSPPSGRIVQRSYTGSSPKRTTLTFANTDTNVTEVYRSSAFAANDTDEPTDEMILIGTAEASASTFIDDAGTTGLWGGSLYANATQDGALLENGITPLCRDVAAFRDMLFFGAARWAPSLTFEVLGFGPDWRGSNASTTDRLTLITITGTSTNTSTTVSGVSASDIAKVRAGQRCYLNTGSPLSSDATYPADTYVVSVNTGAGTFVINNAATASGAATIALSDWIEVSIVDHSGTLTERVFCDDGSGTNRIDAREFQASTSADVRGAQQMAYELSDELNGKATVTAFGNGVDSAWTFVVETYESTVSSLTVKTSNANAINSRIDGTTGKAGESRGSVATLAWSKPGQPEHVPPGYTFEIGAYDKAIERIIPTRDALFVFKQDGIWRVSGYSPDSLQVDEYDRTLRLIHPNAACEWNGRIAAWTNKGVVLLGDGGVEEVGLPIANLFDEAGSEHDGQLAQGLFMVPWIDRGMLLLAVPTEADDIGAFYFYCWSERTRAWSRWLVADGSVAAGAAVGDQLYWGAFGGAVYLSVDNSHDMETAITIASVTGTTISVTPAANVYLDYGSVIRQSSVNYVVTGFPSGLHGDWTFTVHAAGLVAGAAVWRGFFVGASPTVGWTVRDGGNPGAQKVFREATALFGSTSGITGFYNSYRTDRSRTLSGATAELTYTANDNATTVRTRIPRESRRCNRLEHTIRIPGALPAWELHGVSYVYEPKSTRAPNAA